MGVRLLGARRLYLIALLLRVSYALWARPLFDGTYWGLADSILADGSLSIDGHPTTDYEPLYPAFLAVCRIVTGSSVVGVQGLQIAVAALGVVLIYRLTAALTQNSTAATLSAALFALDPLLIRQAVQHSEASLATTLLLAFSVVFVRAATAPGAALSGAVLGLAILTRAMIAPVAAAGTLIWLARRRYGAALAFATAVSIVVVPYAARNASLNGSWGPTRGGLNLFVGNHPYAAALLPEHDVDVLATLAEDVMRQHGVERSEGAEYEGLADRILTRQALAYMSAAPWRTAMQKLRNIWYFFSPRPVPYRTGGSPAIVTADGRIDVEGDQPRPRLETILPAAFYSIVLAFAAAGAYSRRARLGADAVLWSIVATFVVVYSVYFPATRYRGPMSFIILYYAAVSTSQLRNSQRHK